MKDEWIPPFSVKIINNFLNEDQYNYIMSLVKKSKFKESCQGVNGVQMVQKDHKIRMDYTLNNEECSVIDKPLIEKADCKCNLRERWRLLYYNGKNNSFRGKHTDWTSHSCHRRMSIVIGLSDPDEYDGGELIFNNFYGIKLKVNKGDAVIFDAKLIHEVLPVTGGNRYVIQAFLFDDSGFSLRPVFLNKNNFILLENRKTTNENKERKLNDNIKDFKLFNNKNAHYGKIRNIEENYIGKFNYLYDLKKYIETEYLNKNIYCFTWHKPEHVKKQWAGRAYIWTKTIASENKRILPSSWINENNIISGIRYKIENENKTENENKKYLTIISTDGGPGNQIVGIKEGLIMSKILNKEFIFPPIIQHYVLNRKYRGDTENKNALKYWNFNEIFNYKNSESLDLIKNKDKFNNLKNIYYLKNQDLTSKKRIESIINIESNNKILLNKRNFKKIGDYEELKLKENENIVINNLYNNTAISECYWNGCDKCEMNKEFINIYEEICKNLDFTNKIKLDSDNYIKEIFNNKEYISLHLRYPDYINNNTDLNEINKLYNEDKIYEKLLELCNNNNISKNNIFIATNNQNKLLNSKLKDFKILLSKKEYDEKESFIEQMICMKSKYFIYTGGDNAKSSHIHLRSTWASFVNDYRKYKLNINEKYNIYFNKLI